MEDGVSTVERTLQRLQAEIWTSLKWSLGVLVMITFSRAHAGQVNRILFPALVPSIPVFSVSFVIGVFCLMVFHTRHNHGKPARSLGHPGKKGLADMDGDRPGAGSPVRSRSGFKTVYGTALLAVIAYRMMQEIHFPPRRFIGKPLVFRHGCPPQLPGPGPFLSAGKVQYGTAYSSLCHR